ncbi:NUDIX hydrolase [Metabacillus iocasae]|uniref:8-oxo-dGTP pyrophosphatase MutT (NUDIX family) n=1 Tax=Priestia iocasae TaxID=2291674 RepID=A0ABS2QW57_9BACI|nr:CoA pyrophosphatase [Metabacillus iocasae]MBM7703719.1 8-oxo-dGTP pyrophosphatase MutT (NUDIX family) [Metabacillus iocasae]
MDINQINQKLKSHTPRLLGMETFKRFSVLVPLIEKENDLHVLFEVRALNMRRQPGEICFPGGKVDATDPNEKYTAIRETIEELRIKQEQIKDVQPLDYMISPFGTIIYPYVGVLQNIASFSPNPTEVEEVFTVPLNHFKQTPPERYKVQFQGKPEASFPFHLIANGEEYNWQTRAMDEYFYYYNDKVIWGLTAKILHHFLQVID